MVFKTEIMIDDQGDKSAKCFYKYDDEKKFSDFAHAFERDGWWHVFEECGLSREHKDLNTAMIQVAANVI